MSAKGFNLIKIGVLLLGFPVIAVYALIKSWTVYEYNYSYFPYVLAGMGLLLLLALLYAAAVALTGQMAKKSKNINGIFASTMILVAVGALLSTGVWSLIDKYVPPVISNATQDTITYEDIKEDYENRAIAHAELLSGFVEMNVQNGRLSPEKADIYREEGYGNKEVRELIANSFNSITWDGYDTFNGMLVNFANGGRLTVPVLMHLLFDERQDPWYGYNGYTGEGRGEENKNQPLRWSVLDLQGGAMTFSIDAGGLIPTDYNELLDWILPTLFDDGGMLETLLKSVDSAIASEELVGSPIYVAVDYAENTITISVQSSNGSRGVHDYMSMAWLNSNHLLMAVFSIFPVRNAFYIFGGLLALTGFALGAVRQKQYARSWR
ncbi:MAG: hypothetical protein LBP62_01445 [Clostridiales bacterium]|jgi:hypothetical protein|nr:hypothetical protein [Clostridiales bacterium]